MIEVFDAHDQTRACLLDQPEVDQPDFPPLGFGHYLLSSRSYSENISADAFIICWYSSNQEASSATSADESCSMADSISATELMSESYREYGLPASTETVASMLLNTYSTSFLNRQIERNLSATGRKLTEIQGRGRALRRVLGRRRGFGDGSATEPAQPVVGPPSERANAGNSSAVAGS